jgi:hypothetical protein
VEDRSRTTSGHGQVKNSPIAEIEKRPKYASLESVCTQKNVLYNFLNQFSIVQFRSFSLLKTK